MCAMERVVGEIVIERLLVQWGNIHATPFMFLMAGIALPLFDMSMKSSPDGNVFCHCLVIMTV
jgi:hypothetical protein